MSILDILNEPWAMIPSKKMDIDAVYMDHRRGPKIDVKAVEAALGSKMATTRSYDVVNGDAIIPIEGVISKQPSLFQAVCGGVSTNQLGAKLEEALADPAVDRIIFAVDSPGGTVDGTKALGDAIYAARGKKPMVAWVDGLAASAAYWLCSAADEVYLKDTTSFAGSIGVIATHVDISGAEAQAGVKTTEITAGKYKRPDSSYAPLTEEGRASIQDRVDALYSVFLGDVARNRGVDPEQAHERMADGRVFMGQAAVDAGLVDGVATWAEMIAMKKTNQPNPKQKGFAMFATKEEFDKALADGLAAAAPKTEEAQAAERARIQGVLDAALPGYEDEAKKLAFDGKTTPGDAALIFAKMEKDRRSAEAAEATKNAPPALKTDKTTDDPGASASEKDAELKTRWNAMSAAQKKLFGGDFEKYAKGRRAVDEGISNGTVRAFSRPETKTK